MTRYRLYPLDYVLIFGLFLAALFLGVVAVFAADRPITITASPQEVQQLGQMLEQYEKACSVFQPMTQCVVPPMQWEMKLQQAIDAANKPLDEKKP